MNHYDVTVLFAVTKELKSWKEQKFAVIATRNSSHNILFQDITVFHAGKCGYRRENYPQIYSRIVPIFFELDDHEYVEVFEKAEVYETHPNDYIKSLAVKKEYSLQISFTNEDW